MKDHSRSTEFDKVKIVKTANYLSMFIMNNVWSSLFERLPVEIKRVSPRLSLQEECFDEVSILCYDNVLFFDREFVDDAVGSSIAVREI